MEQEYTTTINGELLFWSGLAAIEILILAVLIPFPLIIFLGLVLINPFRTALAWRVPVKKEGTSNSDSPSQTEGSAPS